MPIIGTLAGASARGLGGLRTFGAAGAVGAFESIATYTGTATSIVTFSSIPGTFDHLHLRITARGGGTGSTIYSNVRANGDSNGNYTYHYFEDTGVDSISSGSVTSSTAMYSAYIAGGGSSANYHSIDLIDILDYANVNKYKTFHYSGVPYDGSDGRAAVMTGAWMNKTSAITSISIESSAGNWTANSHFALYGIKGS